MANERHIPGPSGLLTAAPRRRVSGMVHCGPRREGAGQHLPDASRADRIEDRFDHEAPWPLEGPSSGFRWRRQRLQRCPLGVGKVRGIPVLTGVLHGCLGLKSGGIATR
jgi:hypothetical protein